MASPAGGPAARDVKGELARSDDGRVVLRALQRCRRRAFVLTWLSHAVLMTAVVTAIVGVAAFMPVPGGEPAVILPVSGTAAVLVIALGSSLAALATAAASTPSIVGAAAAIDRRLALPDVAAAAVEHSRSADPIAVLIVRAAAAPLRELSPALIFPFVFRPATVVAAVFTISALLVLSASARRDGATPRLAAAPGPGGGAAGTARAGLSQGNTAPARARATAAAVPATTAATASARAAAASPDALPPAGVNAPGDRRSSRPATASADGTAGHARAQGQQLNGQDAAASASAMPLRASSADIARRRGAGDSGAAGGAARTRGAGAGAGTGASTGDAPQVSGRSGGGISGASPLAGAKPGASSPPGAARVFAEYQAAARNAEAAVSRQEIAPRDRAVVRRYFSSLTPPGP